MSPSQTKPIVLVIGANQGVGYHAVQQLAATNNYTVLLGSRDLSKGTQAAQEILSEATKPIDPNTLIPIQIDLTSDNSIQLAAETIEERFGRLDIFICNAGIASTSTTQTRSTTTSNPSQDAFAATMQAYQTALASPSPTPTLRQQFSQLFNTNSFGPVVAAETFLPLLRRSQIKRLLFVSSGLGLTSFALPDSPFPAHLYPVYRASKAALNMSILSLASQLESEGFTVAALDPGHVKTNLNNYTGSKDPADAAKVLVLAVEEEEREALHRRFMKFEEGERGYWEW